MRPRAKSAPATPQTRPGTHLALRVERLATGGRGVAHHEGRVVFVEGPVAPTDRVEATVLADKGRFLEARLGRILEPSSTRVAPRCTHFGTCGGCSWQHIPYDEQLRIKKGLLEDSLRRLGRLERWPDIAIVHGEPWGTRNRAQFQPGPEGMPWGFFESGSRQTVPLRECPVLAPELQDAWLELRGLAGDPDAARRERSVFAWGAQGHRHLSRPGETAPVAEVRILDRPFRFPVDGFFQSNLSLVPRMVETALHGLEGRRALDLYCGVGLFAGFLEDRFPVVDAVESDPRSARFAPGNLRSARFHRASVEDWLDRSMMDQSLRDVDAVVVDPPREGLSERTMKALLAMRPRELRYVSCGHDTLARDLRQFVSEGFLLDRIVLIDLYPHTPHLEVVCSLRCGF